MFVTEIALFFKICEKKDYVDDPMNKSSFEDYSALFCTHAKIQGN